MSERSEAIVKMGFTLEENEPPPPGEEPPPPDDGGGFVEEGAFQIISFTNYDHTVTISDMSTMTISWTLVFETNMPVTNVNISATRDLQPVSNPFNSPYIEDPEPAQQLPPDLMGFRYTYGWTRVYPANVADAFGSGRTSHTDSVTASVTVNDSEYEYPGPTTSFVNDSYAVQYIQYKPYIAAGEDVWTSTWPLRLGPSWQSWPDAGGNLGHAAWDGSIGSNGQFYYTEAAITQLRSDAPNGTGEDFTMSGTNNVSKWSEPNYGYEFVAPWHRLRKRYIWLDGESESVQYDSVTFSFTNQYGTTTRTRSQAITVYQDTGTPSISSTVNTSSATVNIGGSTVYTFNVTGADAMYVSSVTGSVTSGSGSLLVETSSNSETTTSAANAKNGEHRLLKTFTLTVPAQSSPGSRSHTVTFSLVDNTGDTATTARTVTTTTADLSGPTVSNVALSQTSALMPVSGSIDIDVTISASDNYTSTNQLKAFVGAYFNGSLIASNPPTDGELILPTLGLSRSLNIPSFAETGVPYTNNTVVITAIVEDEAGNQTSGSSNLIVDFDFPMTANISLASGNSSTINLPPGTNTAQRTFNISADDQQGITALRVKQDGVTRYTHSISSAVASINQSITFTYLRYDYYPYQTVSHSHAITMEVTDIHGTTLTFSLSGGLTVYAVPDTTPPTGTLTASYNGNSIANNGTFDMTNLSTADIVYNVTASDNDLVGFIRILDSIAIGGYSEASDKTSAQFTRSIARGSEPSTTTLTTRVELEDPAYNRTTLTHVANLVVNDITGPTITVGEITAGGTIAGNKLSTSVYLLNNQTQEVTFEATASDVSAISSITLTGHNGSDYNGSLSTSGTVSSRTFKRTYLFSDGSLTDTLTLTVTDTAGNTATRTFTVSVIADGIPSMSVFAASTSSVSLVDTNPVEITFRVVAADDIGIDTIQLLKNNTSYSIGSATVVATYNANGSTSADQYLPYTYIRGQNGYNVGSSGTDYYWAKVTDTQGQTRKTTSVGTALTYTVPDVQAPTPTLELTSSSNVNMTHISSTVLTFTLTATDDLTPTDFEFTAGSADSGSITELTGGTWGRTFTRTLLRSSFNEPSTNTVTTSVRVRDAAGNWSSVVSQNVTIVLEDITAPTITSLAVVTSLSSAASSVAQNTGFTLNSSTTSQYIALLVHESDGSIETNSYLQYQDGTTAGLGGLPYSGYLPGGSNNPGGYVYARTYNQLDSFFRMNEDQTLVLQAKATDSAGNSSGYYDFPIVFRVRDTAGPSLAITSISPSSMTLGGTISAQNVAITVSASDAIATLSNSDVTLSRTFNGSTTNITSFSRSGSTWTFNDTIAANASAGFYQYIATATDNSPYSGDSTTTPAELQVIRDDTAPAGLSLTHNASADRKIYLYSTTASQTVVVTASSSSNDVARFTFSSANPSASSSDTSSPYQFSKTFSADYFSEGSTTSTITAYAVDEVGNQSGTVSLDFTIIKDITPPSLSSLQHGFGSLSYLTPTVTSKQANITFNASDAITTISQSNIALTASMDGSDITGDMAFAYVSQSGSSFVYTATLSRGDFPNGVQKTVTITASVTDDSGRTTSSSVNAAVLRDDNGPTISSITANPSSIVFNSTTASTRDVTFTIEASDSASGLSTIVFNGETGSFTNGVATFVRTLNASSYANEQTNQITTYSASVTDIAGNSSSGSVSVSVDRDETLPTASISVSPTSRTFTESGQSQLVTVDVSADGTGTNVQSVSVTPSGWTAEGLQNGAYRFTKTLYAADYTNDATTASKWNVVVTDAAGNQKTYTDGITVNITKDTTHPTVSATTNVSTVNFTGVGETATVTVTLTASDPSGISTRTVTGGIPVNGTADQFTVTLSGNDSRWNTEGDSYVLTINGSATDVNGNSSSTSTTVTVNQLDVTDPAISISLDGGAASITSLESQGETKTVTVLINASDNVALAGAPVLSSNDSRVSVGTVGASGVSGQWQSVVTFDEDQYPSPGSYGFTFTAAVTDTSSRTSTTTLGHTVSVSDYTNPVIHVDTISVSPSTAALSGGNDITLTITAEVSDNVAGLPDPTLDGSAPTSFTVVSSTRKSYTYQKVVSFDAYAEGFSGSVSYLLSATDAAGNSSSSAVVVPVTKADETAPDFTLQGSATALTFDGGDAANQNIVYEAINIVEAVGISKFTVNGVEKTQSPWRVSVPFSPHDVNTTVNVTVTAILEDTSGNTTTKTTSVAVTTRDVEPPEISVAADKTTVTLNSSTQSDEVVFTVQELSDDSGSITFIPPDDLVVVSTSIPFAVKKVFNASDSAFPIGQTTTYTARFYAEDPSGNQSYVDLQITVTHEDDVAPTADLSLSTTELFFNGSGQSATIVATATITDAVNPDGLASITGGFSLVSTSISGQTKTVVWNKTISSDSFTSYHRQTYPVVLSVEDNAGNAASANASYIVNLDTEPPALNRVDILVGGSIATPTFQQSDPDSTYIDIVAHVYTLDNSGTTPYITITGFTYTGNSQPWIFQRRIFRSEVSQVGSTSIATTMVIRDAVGVGLNDGSNETTLAYNVPVLLEDDVNPVIQELVVTEENVILSSSNTSQTVVFSVLATDTAGTTTVSAAGLTPVSGSSQYLSGGKDFTKEYLNSDTSSYPYNQTVTETYTFVATDEAGNTISQDKSITITNTDSVAPVIQKFQANITDVTLNGGTPSVTVTISALATDNVGVASYTMPSEWTYIGISGSDRQYQRTFNTADTNLWPLGQTTPYSVTLSVSDAASNTSTQSLTLNISNADTTAPSISAPTITPASIILGTGESTTVTISVTASDSQTGLNTASATLNGSDLPTGTLSVSGNTLTFTTTWTFDHLDGKSLGTHTYSGIGISVSDTAGNTATSSTGSLSVTKRDITDPQIQDLTIVNAAGDVLTEVTVTDTNPVYQIYFVGNVSDNYGLSTTTAQDSLSNNLPLSAQQFTGFNSGFGPYSINYANFGAETESVSTSVTYTMTATDLAGNTQTANVSLIVNKTNTPPAFNGGSISLSTDTVTLSPTNQSETITITASVSDYSLISASCLIIESQEAIPLKTSAGGTFTFEKTYTYSGEAFNYSNQNPVARTDTFRVTATDGTESSTADAAASISKIDTESPSLSIVASPSGNVELNSSITSVTKTYTVTCSDNDALAPGSPSLNISGSRVTYVGQSGNTFTWQKVYHTDDYAHYRQYTDSVVATATDRAGNTTVQSVGTTIIKSDTQSPVAASGIQDDVSSSVLLTTASQTKVVNFQVVATDDATNASAGEVISALSYASQTSLFQGQPWYGSQSTATTYATNNTTGLTSSDAPHGLIYAYAFSTGTNRVSGIKAEYHTSPPTTQLVELPPNNAYTYALRPGLTPGSLTVSSGATPSVVVSGDGLTYTYSWAETYEYSNYSYGATPALLTASLRDGAQNVTNLEWNGVITKSDTESPVISGVTVSPSTVILTQQAPTATVTVSMTVTDNRAVSQVLVSPDGHSLQLESQGSSGSTYTWTKTFAFADYSPWDGPTQQAATTTVYDFIASASDAAANQSTTHSFSITVKAQDNLSPTISSFTLTPSSFSLRDGEQQVVAAAVSASDDNHIFQVLVSGFSYVGFTNGSWQFTKTYSWADLPAHGVNELTAVATVTDAASNSSTAQATVYGTNVDSINPVITSFEAAYSDYSLDSGDIMPDEYNIVVTASYSDNLSSIATVEVTGGLTFTNPEKTTMTKTISNALYPWGDTFETYTLTVTDTDGNTATASTTVRIYKQDTTPPTISNPVLTPSTITLSANNTSETVTFICNIADNKELTYVALPGYTLVGTSGSQLTFQRSFSYSDYVGSADMNPTHTSVLTAADGAGLTATYSVTTNIVVEDVVSPGIASYSATGATVTTSQPSSSGTVVATVTDDWSINSATLTKGVTSIGTLSVSGTTYTWTIDYAYADYTTFGTNSETYTITATDANGNTSTQDVSALITKSDDQAPTIHSFTASPNEVTLTSDLPSKIVTITADISDNVALSGLPGLPFVGATFEGISDLGNGQYRYTWTKSYSINDYSFGTVTETATITHSDTSGNSASSSVSIQINKPDQTAPVMGTVYAETSPIFIAGGSGSVDTYVYVSITDDAGANALSFSETEGATYDPTKTSTEGIPNRYYFKTTFAADYPAGASTRSIQIRASDGTNSSTASISLPVRKVQTAGVPIVNYIQANAASVTLSGSSLSATVTYLVDVISDSATSVVLGSVLQASPSSTPTSSQQLNGGGVYQFQVVYSYNDYNAGANTVDNTATATGSAGTGSLASSFTVTKEADTSAPTISSFTANQTALSFRRGDANVTVTFTAEVADEIGVQSVSGSDLTLVTPQSGNTYVFTKSFGFDFAKSGTVVDESTTITATDTVGNTSTATAIVQVHYIDFREISVASNQQVIVEANLNASIFSSGGYLGFEGGTLNSTTTDAVFNLPAASATFPCGDITGIGLDGQSVGVINGHVTVSTTGNGTMSAQVSLTGGPLIAEVNEDVNLTQVVSWVQDPQVVVTSTTADQLSAEFTTIDAATYYKDIIDGVEALYDGNAISSWTFEVGRIEASQTSAIHEYAVYKDRLSQGTNVFEDGEHIVLQTAHRYSLSVPDINGSEVILINPIDVYAVLKHDSSKPALAALPSVLLFPGGWTGN